MKNTCKKEKKIRLIKKSINIFKINNLMKMIDFHYVNSVNLCNCYSKF